MQSTGVNLCRKVGDDYRNLLCIIQRSTAAHNHSTIQMQIFKAQNIKTSLEMNGVNTMHILETSLFFWFNVTPHKHFWGYNPMDHPSSGQKVWGIYFPSPIPHPRDIYDVMQ